MSLLRILAVVLLLPACLLAAEVQTKLDFIETESGDTLRSVAQKYLDDPTQWREILRHNKLPTKSPDVPLKATVLWLPSKLMKVRYRAAYLIDSAGTVLAREVNTTAWIQVAKGRLLHHDDGIKTRDDSWARVRFHDGSVISIGPNTTAVLQAPKKSAYDVFLTSGTVYADRSRIKTGTSIIIPRGQKVQFNVTRNNDKTAEVQVYGGAADIKDLDGLDTVTVKTGHMSKMDAGGLPEAPIRMLAANPAAEHAFSGRSDWAQLALAQNFTQPLDPGFDLDDLLPDIIGNPVAAYHIQIADDREFKTLRYDVMLGIYDKKNLRSGLPNGKYWIRAATIDLLGDKGEFSKPRPYPVGPQ
ncbi:MAG: FecR family protein [Elusimicrobiota bacterium]